MVEDRYVIHENLVEFVKKLQESACILLKNEIKALPSHYFGRNVKLKERLIDLKNEHPIAFMSLKTRLMSRYFVTDYLISCCPTIRELDKKVYGIASDMAKQKIDKGFLDFDPWEFGSFIKRF